MSQDSNTAKLRTLLIAFDIPNTAVATAGGVSPSFVSRLLNPTDNLKASDTFWRKLEIALPKLLEERRSQVFDIQAVPVERIEALGKKSG